MRLICPNCGAQYEVDDSLVPDAGRDVQCSNCGHAWFQMPAHLDPGLSEELGLAPAASEPPAPPQPEPEAEPVAEPPQRPALDPTIRSILVEEGARETKARRGEGVIETQGDLGLTEADSRGSGARERMARLRGLDSDDRAEGAATALAAATAAGSRRDLLPDIEEINSSLRPAEERGVALDDDIAPGRRSGFGLGFMLVVLAAVMGLGVYIFADRIVALVPASEGVLNAYVGWVDGVRAWLEAMAQDWVGRLSNMVDSVKQDPAGG